MRGKFSSLCSVFAPRPVTKTEYKQIYSHNALTVERNSLMRSTTRISAVCVCVLTGLDLDCGGGEVGGGARGEGGVHRRGGAVAVVRVRGQHRRGQRPVRGQRLRVVRIY